MKMEARANGMGGVITGLFLGFLLAWERLHRFFTVLQDGIVSVFWILRSHSL